MVSKCGPSWKWAWLHDAAEWAWFKASETWTEKAKLGKTRAASGTTKKGKKTKGKKKSGTAAQPHTHKRAHETKALRSDE